MITSAISKQTLHRRSRYTVPAALILLAACAVNLDALRSGRVAALFHNLRTPNSGEEEVLPPEVRATVAFLRQRGVRTMSVSPALARNRFAYQPLVESAYPITVVAQGNILVATPSEPLPPDCATVFLLKGIRVASCR